VTDPSDMSRRPMGVPENWIDQARCIRTEDVLRERGILETLKKSGNGNFAGPCPNCGGRDRFGVNLSKGNGGVFNCRGCLASGGDAISLVMFLDGCSFVRAVEVLAGPPPDGRGETEDQRREREQRRIERRERLEREKIEREAREAEELQNRLCYCDALWRETVPLPPQAIAYFAERRIDINAVPDQGSLRFHAQCPFDGLTLPCILARFTDAVTNATGGIWRRPMTREKPKSLGPIRRHVIRLWPDEYVELGLCLGEGIETTLSAALGFPHRRTLLQPAWAAGCADNLRNFPVLDGIEFLTVFADNDESGTGQEAAITCAQRWMEADREAEVLTPTLIGDFNDLLRGAS